MGFVSGLIGTGGGAGGSGFAKPSSANILNPTTVAQANTAYTGNQNALQQQQQFLQAVQAQNGLGNQSNVYNQLQGVVNGTGPNPAKAQLAQATGANIANQAALMAGQRGSNANAGLIARQAAQQGSQIQQNAAGQAATLQAQQSLNALQGAGNIANTQAAQQAQATSANTQAQQSEQQNLLNSIAQQNNANVGMQSNVNSSNAGLAGNVMGAQQGLFGGAANAIGSLFADGGKVYLADGGTYADPNTPDNPFNQQAQPVPQVVPQPPLIPGGVPAQPQAAPQSGPKSKFSNFMKAATQKTSDKDQGQGIQLNDSQGAKAINQGVSNLGKGIANLFKSKSDSSSPDTKINMDRAGGPSDSSSNQQQAPDTMMAAKGGKVPAMVSPGEQYIPPDEVKDVKDGKKSPLEAGERIPGKPKFLGNDYRNDVVPKTLESGGLVIPNKVMQSKNPHWAALKFVQAHMAKGGKVLPKKPSK